MWELLGLPSVSFRHPLKFSHSSIDLRPFSHSHFPIRSIIGHDKNPNVLISVRLCFSISFKNLLSNKLSLSPKLLLSLSDFHSHFHFNSYFTLTLICKQNCTLTFSFIHISLSFSFKFSLSLSFSAFSRPAAHQRRAAATHLVYKHGEVQNYSHV